MWNGNFSGMKRTWRALAGFAVCLALLWQPALRAEDSPNIKVAKALSGAFAEIVDKISPSVVGVRKIQNVDLGASGMGGMDSPLDQFFRDDEQMRKFFEKLPKDNRMRKAEGYGSGVVIDNDGRILTNNHVVEGADKLIVEFADDTKIEAEIVGRDTKTDIAVIKLKEAKKELVPAKLGDSDAIKVGNLVLAVGSPFTLKQTVTTGIVSAKHRSVGMIMYENFIQTDASINPGNSGGPLVNLDGEVIGINTMIQTRSGGSVGVGFAVPINMAKKVVEQLIKTGKVTRGWLGVGIGDVTPEMAAVMPGVETGVIVTEVYADTPAKQAGFEAGDVVVEFDGRAVSDAKELQQMVAACDPGKKVPVTVVRKGEKKTLELVVGEQPENLAQGGNGGVVPEGNKAESANEMIGLKVQTADDALRRLYNLDDDAKGVVVRDVTPNGPADSAGIERGALIIELDQKPVPTAEAFDAVLKDLKAKKRPSALVYFKQDGVARFGVLKFK